MPRWICPHCNATMKVAPGLVGQQKPCLGCGAVSQVFDADFQPAIPMSFGTHSNAVSSSMIARIKEETPLYVTLYRAGAVAQLFVVFVVCL